MRFDWNPDAKSVVMDQWLFQNIIIPVEDISRRSADQERFEQQMNTWMDENYMSSLRRCQLQSWSKWLSYLQRSA